MQERKVKQWKGYNSTWQDKHSLGLSTQTWHGAHKHIEDGIKQAEHRSEHTSIWKHGSKHINIDLGIGMATCVWACES